MVLGSSSVRSMESSRAEKFARIAEIIHAVKARIRPELPGASGWNCCAGRRCEAAWRGHISGGILFSQEGEDISRKRRRSSAVSAAPAIRLSKISCASSSVEGAKSAPSRLWSESGQPPSDKIIQAGNGGLL